MPGIGALGEVPKDDLSESPSRVRRGVGGAAAVAGLAVVMFATGAVGILQQMPSQDPSAVVTAADLPTTVHLSIDALQRRLRAAPRDSRSWAILGLAYVQQARITMDPNYYPRAEGALKRSFELRPSNNFEASIGRGALTLGRHRFAAALRWGRRARAINRDAASAYGVIGDAQLELGRYRAAFATLQRMVNLKPDVASYARASYVRELLGNVAGAEQAMQLSLDAASAPEDKAFAAHHLGELAWDSGRPAAAARWYRQALALAPGYVPPRVGLAKVAWAKGRTDAAIDVYRRVVARAPLPEYAAAQGDLYVAAGRPAMADRQYALVRAQERLLRAAGVNVDLEVALFDADHGRPRAALAAARNEWRRRKSIHVADAMAWALYRNERYDEASRFSSIALKLGTNNALFHFHRGMIELARGNRAAGLNQLRTALETNPHFSIRHSETAARLLGEPGATS